MYGFKVFVSTLIAIFMTLVVFAVIKQPTNNGKGLASAFLIIEALSLMAIWG